ncbi:hypothetical protein CDCA_CDCA04G1163 [Cyanidium caldarium]|uniref:Uncharacterized protein n=1 Tax=Cyanidium caldarium TaxID=2771 RepID=A0AAV9ISA4_CYACA|nr:hypothetical protein CDCA_CDCA04G1163 [Cyanidium caldarium]
MEPGGSTRRDRHLDEAVLEFLLMEIVIDSFDWESSHASTTTTTKSLSLPNTAHRIPAPSGPPALVSHLRASGRSAEADRVAVSRIESIGFRVGERLAERCLLHAITLSDRVIELDAVKFVCKDVWQALFGKQVDNLKTNHKGVFVLFDARLRWLRRVRETPVSDGVPAMWGIFPAAVLRGALTHLQHPCRIRVQCEPAPPSAVFTVKMMRVVEEEEEEAMRRQSTVPSSADEASAAAVATELETAVR